MKKLLTLVAFLFLILCARIASAQDLRIDSRGTDTALFLQGMKAGKGMYIKYYIINTGTAESDTTTIYTHVKINGRELDSVKTKITRGIKPYFGAVKDSFHVITGELLPPDFVTPQVGSPVIIVIWPPGSGFHNISPFKDSIMFIYTSIESTSEISPGIKIYPNPANNVLHFDVEKQDISLRKVEITDLSGRMISSYANEVREINISMIPTGIYLLNLHFSDGSTARFKLIRN